MATLYDHRGNKIDMGRLREEVATTSVTSVRRPDHPSIANDLTPAKLASILERARRGDARDYLTLAEEMEERHFQYGSTLETRKLAIQSLDINVEAAGEDAQSQKIAEAVEAQLDRAEFRLALFDLGDAVGKGFAQVEIIWEKDSREWVPARFEWRDPRFFVIDKDNLTTLRLLDEENMVDGVPLAPFKWIQHRAQRKSGIPVRGGTAMIAAVAYVATSFALRDWLAFQEIFGQPFRVGYYGPGANDSDIAKMIEGLRNLGSDAAALFPEGMKAEIIAAQSGAGGVEGYPRLCEYLDKAVSKINLGQTMTSDDGSSYAQSETHNEVRHERKEADAMVLSISVNRDLVRAYVDLNFGPQKRYPRVNIYVDKPEDLKSFTESITPLIDRGLKVKQKQIADKYGLEEVEDGDEILHPKDAKTSSGGGGDTTVSGEEPGSASSGEDASKQNSTAAAPSDSLEPALNAEGAGAIASEPDPGENELDAIEAEALADWEPMLTPTVDSIEAALENVETVEQLEEALAKLAGTIDQDELIRRLATATFKARALGNESER